MDDSLKIQEAMTFYGFVPYPGKPGHWVEPYSGFTIRHRNLVRWAQESPDLRKRIWNEIGRLVPGLRDWKSNPWSISEDIDEDPKPDFFN